MQTLRIGAKGAAVVLLQNALIKLGSTIKADGDFGPLTAAEVISFQQSKGLDPDGIVGDKTWAALGVSEMPVGSPRGSNEKNITSPPGKNIVKGIDISHYQPTVDWKRAKATGLVDFCFLKASEGLGSTDGSYNTHRNGAKAQGIPIAAYHFFRPDSDAGGQADWFLHKAQPRAGDIVPIIDFEAHGSTKSRGAQIAAALKFLEVVEKAIGRLPIFYSYVSFINELGNPQEFFKYPLWLANYGVKAPHLPPPWNEWQWWQYAEQGKVDGIQAAGVDHNYFNGTMDDLKKYIL